MNEKSARRERRLPYTVIEMPFSCGGERESL